MSESRLAGSNWFREAVIEASFELRLMALYALVNDCQARYRSALMLIEIRGPEFQIIIENSCYFAPTVNVLFGFWQRIIHRYLADGINVQLELFHDGADPVESSLRAFIFKDLWPRIVASDECVRAVLRSTGWLPCKSDEDASKVLEFYIRSLPSLQTPLAERTEDHYELIR